MKFNLPRLPSGKGYKILESKKRGKLGEVDSAQLQSEKLSKEKSPVAKYVSEWVPSYSKINPQVHPLSTSKVKGAVKNGMSKFIELYKQHEVLWNPKVELYNNRRAEQIALHAIIYDLGKSNITEIDLKSKIRNMRAIYKRELRKVLKSEKNRPGSTSVYKPTLQWFDQADLFLREVTIARNNNVKMGGLLANNNKIDDDSVNIISVLVDNQNKTTRNGHAASSYTSNTTPNTKDISIKSRKGRLSKVNTSKTNKSIDTQTSNGTIEENSIDKDDANNISVITLNESVSLIEILTSKEENVENSTKEDKLQTNIALITKTIPYSVEDNIINNVETNQISFISPSESATYKMNNIENNTTLIFREDEFETFGKHIANQMRLIPLERAVICQSEIQAILTRERIKAIPELQDSMTLSAQDKRRTIVEISDRELSVQSNNIVSNEKNVTPDLQLLTSFSPLESCTSSDYSSENFSAFIPHINESITNQELTDIFSEALMIINNGITNKS